LFIKTSKKRGKTACLLTGETKKKKGLLKKILGVKNCKPATGKRGKEKGMRDGSATQMMRGKIDPPGRGGCHGKASVSPAVRGENNQRKGWGKALQNRC